MPKSPKQTDQLPHSLVRQKTVSSTSKVTSTSKENNEPAPAAFKFNKEKWVATLTDEQKDLLKLEIDTLHESQDIPFNTVKAVIIGQDPYHNFNQAHGLCFSVRAPTPAPPSLKNIFKALAKDYPDFKPPPNNGGLLTPWADRGVLLINTCLTVRAHQANSHANHGWERFTQKVIDTVALKRTKGGVF
ncbi:hypothetical protein DID88_008960 [Monilinia fructigena]|uniref:Uracil-DNA glycosylase-like domain-containing protein n=1 Tax=Monilinia fructigena TaxID=38457 RepID=A0A395J732_9HELO|nr:hypothetical protein DID88_008960 [Monilinia fructigena]